MERPRSDGEPREPVTMALARLALGIRERGLTPAESRAATRGVLDWFGATIAGSVMEPARILEQALAGDASAGLPGGVLSGAASLVPSGRRLPARTAALINAAASHTAEMDDIYREGIYHPGSPTVAAALAVAEALGRSGADLLRAVAIGYEVGDRIAETVNPAHYRYWHTTGTVGTIGAAAATAALLEADTAAFAHALATAATMGAGLQQAFRSDAMSKPLHAGHAAEAGVLAGLAAARGYTGALDVLEGASGLGAAMAGSPDWSAATASPGRPLGITRATVKNHSCCGHTFAAVDAALSLRASGLRAEQVESVEVRTYATAVEVAGIRDPATAFEAKFSAAYCVAAALVLGSVRLRAFEPAALADPRLRQLAARVRLVPDAGMERDFPGRRRAVLTAVDSAGQAHVAKRDTRKGDPDDPLDDAELAGKFDDLSSPVLGADRAARLAAAIWGLASLPAASHIGLAGDQPGTEPAFSVMSEPVVSHRVVSETTIGRPLAVVRPFYGGQWRDGAQAQQVTDKFTGIPVTSLGCCDAAQVTAAVSAVVAGQQRAGSAWDPPARYRALARASALLDEQREDVVAVIVSDTGFTVADARREVDRAVQTLLISGEEAKRLTGEMVPLDGAPGQSGRIGFTVHHPLGVVCAITPFNSPLNTTIHKVAPALAAGNGVILKPASLTPRTADRLLRLLLDAGVPPELLAVVYGSGSVVGQALLEDPRPACYAFTGSTEVGAQLHRTVGLRRTQLEMGSLSSTIICADANVAAATDRLVPAAFRKAGQVCTSVQRLYVERGVADEVVAAIEGDLGGRASGDPADPGCFVGPVISLGDAERIESWVQAAVAAGATCVSGGSRIRSVVAPTVLTDVTGSMDVMTREIFGPVVVVRVFDDLDAALEEVNDTPYGLAAGIFTSDINRALNAASRLRMGSVHINETSSSRVDLMPYTGAKLSGMGREGPRYAIREMSEERLITIGPL